MSNRDSPTDGAKYRFVPYARRGYRPSEQHVFEKSGPDAAAQPTFGVEITPKAKRREAEGGPTWDEDPTNRTVTLSLYGPGDVRGIDTEQIARVEPEPDTSQFPANYFPFVEFDRPDLPWMFSPERADDAGRVRPWLTLVVVTDDDSVDVSVGGRRPLPVLTFTEGADLDRELPDLTESWAWAHVQAHGSPEDVSQAAWSDWLPGELQQTSNITVSRIVAPRNLQPETEYVACLVPTFEAGRRAGLGMNPVGEGSSHGSDTDSDGQTDSASSNPRGGAGTVSLAWTDDSLPQLPFRLPLYHYWRFTAGDEGTFEHLVRRFEPVELGAGVGKKSVDVREPGPESLEPDAGETTTVDVAGALYSVPAKQSTTSLGTRRQERLHTLLNKPETLGSPTTRSSSSADATFPIVGAPLYGQWHAGLVGIPSPDTVSEDDYDPVWFRQLNTTLRNRVAASVGAEVVKEHQNQLMDAAWEVVGEVREANTFTRTHQGVEAFGDVIESGDGGIVDDARRTPESIFDDPWVARRELDRLHTLQSIDVDDLVEGVEGVEPGDIDPRERTTQPVETVRRAETTQPSETIRRAETTRPVNPLVTTYLAPATMGDVVTPGESTAPDGGTSSADGPTPDDPATKAAVYTEYLRTFLDQPETSPQYQRLVRLDGPLGRRTDIGREAYRRTLGRASQRAATEVGTRVDSVLGGTPGRPSDGTADEPESAGEPSESVTTPPLGEAVGAETLLDPETVELFGAGPPGTEPAEPSIELPEPDTGPAEPDTGTPEGAGPQTTDAAPAETGADTPERTSPETTDTGPAEPDTGTPEGVGPGSTGPTPGSGSGGLSTPVVGTGPRTRAVETRAASGAALDARVAGTGVEMGADSVFGDDATPDGTSEADAPPTARGLVETVQQHAAAVEDHLDAARQSLSAGESAAAAVEAAAEAARAMADSLDPLGQALSAAISDQSVTVADRLTDEYRTDRMAALREAHQELVAALTAAHEAAGAGRDGDGTDGDGGDGDDGGSSDRGGSGDDPGTGSGPTAALDDAAERLDRIQSVLDDLTSALSSLSTTATLPGSLELDPSVSARPALDPRRESTFSPDLSGIGAHLASRSGEGRYRRALLTERVSFLSREFATGDDPVERVMVAPELPTPMWRPLTNLGEEYLLPGADDVPRDSVGMVVQNREFIESYMVGLSHEMGRELLWRRYPTDRLGTYFRRFWNRGKGPAWSPGSPFRVGEDVPSRDVEEIHRWDTAKLGCNAPGTDELDKVVLLIRGRLFERYPNTVVYAARAKVTRDDDGSMNVEPMTPERFVEAADPDPGDVEFPTFRGTVGSDITFLGFDLTHEDVYADQEEIRNVVENNQVPREEKNLGWYFVFEERPGETRFGLDAGRDEHAGDRPVGVKDESGEPRYPRDEHGDKTQVEGHPVGWDGLSWYHLVGESGDPATLSYVPVGDSQPGNGDWTVEQDAGDVEAYLEDGFDPSDEATWGKNSAHMARITWQKPVRVSFHAHELLPDDSPAPADTDYCE
jgi:hypothetical protein